MIRADFNKLPGETRELLTAAIENKAPIRPFFSRRRGFGSGVIVALLLLGPLAGLAGWGAFRYRLGDPWVWKQDPAFMAVYAVGIWIVVALLLTVVRNVLRRRALPFSPGAYLFPLDIVVADDALIEVHPLSELRSHSSGSSGAKSVWHFHFSSGTVSFVDDAPIRARTPAELVASAASSPAGRFFALRREIEARGNDRAWLETLDIFALPRRLGSFEIDPPVAGGYREMPAMMASNLRARRVPLLFRLGWLSALVPALASAPVVWWVRNRVSDDRAIETLRVDPYEAKDYLERPGRYADEVRSQLLPRQQFNEWIHERPASIATRAWLACHPGSPAAPLAQAKMDELVAQETDLALTERRVPAYRQFLYDNPDAPRVAEVRADRHAFVTSSLRTFDAGKPPGTVAFFDQLVAHLEANDFPAIVVRFERVPDPSLAVADQLLDQKGGASGGGFAKASPHFDGNAAAYRERTLATALESGLGHSFPNGMISLKIDDGEVDATAPSSVLKMTPDELDAELAAREKDDTVGYGGYTKHDAYDLATLRIYGNHFPGTVTKASPVMHVKYRVVWPIGSTFVAKDTGRTFVGIRLEFEVTLEVPGAARPKKCPDPAPAVGTACPLVFSLKLEPPDRFTLSSDAMKYIDQSSKFSTDDVVYENMAARAYDMLAAQFLAALE